MEIRLGVAKVAKDGGGESGDTVEVVERPRGGVSVIVVDAQGSGWGAKRLSHQVVNKATALIGDGARDGAVVRAVHDYLYSIRDGKVSCTLSLLSVDAEARELVISRNTNSPVLIVRPQGHRVLEGEVTPIGVHRMVKPLITQLPLEPGMVVAAMSDGLLHAGRHSGRSFRVEHALELLEGAAAGEVQQAADALLDHAVAVDGGRPRSDMAMAILGIAPGRDSRNARRLSLVYPL